MMTEHGSPVNEARSEPRSGGMISSPSQIIHANVGMIDASLDSLLMARDGLRAGATLLRAGVTLSRARAYKHTGSATVRWLCLRPSLALIECAAR